MKEAPNSPLKIAVTGNKQFLRPYIEREFATEAKAIVTDSVDEADIVVHTSGTDASVPALRNGQQLVIVTTGDDPAAQMPADATVLRTGWIIGTGMEGTPRRLVNAIARGTFLHIEGHEATHSVIHAIDVARYCRLLAGQQGEFDITDGTTTTVDQLADALACRLNNKHIFTISAKQWRLLSWLPIAPDVNKADWRTVDTILDPSGAIATAGHPKINVINHLKTHQYGEDDI